MALKAFISLISIHTNAICYITAKLRLSIISTQLVRLGKATMIGILNIDIYIFAKLVNSAPLQRVVIICTGVYCVKT